MRRVYVLAVIFMLLPWQPARGEPAKVQDTSQAGTADQNTSPEPPVGDRPQPIAQTRLPDPDSVPLRMPDLISFGASSVDFDKNSSYYFWKNDSRTRTTEYRLEYRFGYALLAAHGNWGVDFGIHPFVGGMTTMRGQYYGFGGFAFDWVFFRHVVVTESEAVGLFDSGDPRVAKPMGSFVEFRSQLEVGWRFDDDIRLTLQASHISNAGLTHRNPGMELVGGYVHVPASYVFNLFSQ